MVEKGLVECSGKGESSDEGGKRPTLFSIHSDYKFGMVILVELDGIYSCIYDLMLTQRHMESEKGPLTTYEECLERISRMIELSLNKVNLVEDDLCGIIIGLSLIHISFYGHLTRFYSS